MTRGSAQWASLISPTITIGTVLSTLLGLAISLTGSGLGVSTLVGMVGISISIGVDLLIRDTYAEVFASPGWMRAKIQRAGELSFRISSSNWPGSFDDQLRVEYDRFLQNLEDLALGRVQYPADEPRGLLELTRSCQDEILGVTNVSSTHDDRSNLSWWKSELGRSYLHENQAAIARGVKVRRIFIYDVRDGDLSGEMKRQQDIGVDVRSVAAASVPPVFRKNVTIWDDEVSWEALMDARGVTEANRFTFGKADVERHKGLFANVEALTSRAGS